MAKHILLTRRHPGYTANAEHWQFLIDTMDAGRAWVDKYIYQYFKEGQTEYADRKKMAYRDNLSRDVVEVYTTYAMKPGVSRDEDTAPPAILDFWKRATRGANGRGIDEFITELSNWTGAVSPCWVVVDMPSRPMEMADKVLSKADESVLGLKPYAYLVMPTDVYDFGADEDDELTWIVIRETTRDDADPLTASGESKERLRVWTRDKWMLFEKDDNTEEGIVLIAEAEHDLGRVPAVPAYHKRGKTRYDGTSLLDDIAYKDRALANFQSQLGTVISDQAFSQLIIPANALILSNEKDEDGARKAIVEMGTKRIFTYDGDAKSPPTYISPDASQGALIQEHIKALRTEIYEDALLDSEGASDKKTATTATERILDFQKLNGALADKAQGLEAVERDILRLVCLWTGTPIPENLESLVVYPREFDTKALADELAEVVGLKDVPGLGPTFWERYAARLVDKVLPDLAKEDKATILEEIKTKLQAEMAPSMANAAIAAVTSKLLSEETGTAMIAKGQGLDPKQERERLAREEAARMGHDPGEAA